ncbi:persulfide dioxygenase ETHE1, mitochondrial-like [Tubulanus polymorphus]|uniref:persulfide dioxygenase ETHE1, mitochondrial-like n=1 Tax=Tubulanus polymorphus TaxID=672921 RepID=UPI003DA34637
MLHRCMRTMFKSACSFRKLSFTKKFRLIDISVNEAGLFGYSLVLKNFYQTLSAAEQQIRPRPKYVIDFNKFSKKMTSYCTSGQQSAGETAAHGILLDDDIIFRQLFEHKSFTYTYLIGDRETAECVLIDPVLETVDRDLKIIEQLGLNLIYGVNTHCHADHITGTGHIKSKRPNVKSIISKYSGAKADILFNDNDFIEFGRHKIQCISTPGHTDGCTTFVWKEKCVAFTGDTLLIKGCGRTDFQAGDPGLLHDSVHGKIFSLPDHFILFPAHDYTGQTMTTVSEEKKFNPRLTLAREDFIGVMNGLNLPYPKQIDAALPANLVCGIQKSPGQLV